MKKTFKLFVFFALVVLILAVSACAKPLDPNFPSGTPSGSTSGSNPSGNSPSGSAPAPSEPIESSISFKTFSVDGLQVNGGTVPNAVTSFDFKTEIEVQGNATYDISLDEYGIQISMTKVVPLASGDNTFYVFEKSGNEILNTYEVKIRRREIYTVTFVTNGDTSEEEQFVEEGGFANKPQTNPTKNGYHFLGWNFDFTSAIIASTTITANWEMGTFYFSNGEITGLTSYGKSLTKIVVPSEIDGVAVTTIREGTFSESTTIANIVVDENNAYYKSIDGNLYTKDVTTLIYYAGGKTDTSFVIPNCVTKIGQRAFLGNEYLESVTIGNNVTIIGNGAFINCYALKNVTIPNSVTTIETSAFLFCHAMTSITIPDSVITVGERIFETRALTIYCEAETKPVGWNDEWIHKGDGYLSGPEHPVVWDCKNNDVADNEYVYVVVDGTRYALMNGEAKVVSQPICDTINISTSITYKGTTYAVTKIGRCAFKYCTLNTTIRFNGTMAQWNALYKESAWNWIDVDYEHGIECTDGNVAI